MVSNKLMAQAEQDLTCHLLQFTVSSNWAPWRVWLFHESCPPGLQRGMGFGVNQGTQLRPRTAAGIRLVGDDSTHNRVCWLEGRCDRKGLELCLLASVQTLNTFKICGQIRKQTRITTWIRLPDWNTSQQRFSCREKSDGIRPYKTQVQVPGNAYKLSLIEHLYIYNIEHLYSFIYIYVYIYSQVALVVKNPSADVDKRYGFDPWVGKMPWRRAWQPTPVFLPREFHGQTSLAGYSLQG